MVEQPNVDAAVEALLGRRVEAVVHDAPTLAWWRVHHPSVPVLTVGRTFDYKDYAIALARDSQLRVRVNIALFTLKEAGFFDELDRRWLGSAER